MFDKNKIKELYPEAEDLMWEPMLIWKLPENKQNLFEDICNSGDYFASLKKDGACYQFVKTQKYSYLFGRTISKVTGLLTEKIKNVPHIEHTLSCLPPKTVLVMEIYYPGKESRDTVEVMGCLPKLAIKRQENNPIHAYVHDILYFDDVDLRATGALNRYKILEKVWEKYNLSAFDFLELARPIYDSIYQACGKALDTGEEGMVLRQKKAPWMPGKRPAWSTIKIKKMDTVDLVCIGFCDAVREYTGKEIGTWPYWEEEITKCLNEDGKIMLGLPNWTPVTKPYYYKWKGSMRVGAYDNNGKIVEIGTVSSGLTDEDREKMSIKPEEYLNKVFHFSCMELNRKDHTLRHPALVGPRPDKNPKECLISEIF